MDAVEFLKAKNRMCREYGKLPRGCFECPIGNDSGRCQAGVLENQKVTEEILVQIVERWSAEHPKKTRQSEFLKMFPIANPSDIDPCNIDTSLATDKRCKNIDCDSCRREFWNEIEREKSQE